MTREEEGHTATGQLIRQCSLASLFPIALMVTVAGVAGGAIVLR